ncbi:hypothetical protein G7046_g6364 [Stylonectria norvegica]|nr:hypothetical protein G7046_g6364 [Stylonectria norvegica]
MDESFSIFTSIRYDPQLTEPLTEFYRHVGYNFHNRSGLYMLDYHRDRLVKAALYWGWTTAIDFLSGPDGLIRLQDLVADAAKEHEPKHPGQSFRVKIILSNVNNECEVSIELYHTPKLVLRQLFPGALPRPGIADYVNDPLMKPRYTLLLDNSTVTSSAFTHFKTTRRDMYDKARERAGINPSDDAEVLLVNQDGKTIMEGSITTPYFWRDKRWVTPPVSSDLQWWTAGQEPYGGGGQDGTTRRWALEKKLVVEAPVEVDSLVHGEECWISNGVRGFIWALIDLKSVSYAPGIFFATRPEMINSWCLTWRFANRPLLHRPKLLCQVSCPGVFSRSFSNYHGLLRQKEKPPFVPSPEQRKVVQACSTQNVVVSARPGSGKTATAEAIVAAHPNERVAILTYSKRLQLETRRRLQNYSNCEVLTFHGMAGFLSGDIVYNDARLSELRSEFRRCNELPKWNSEPFDIILINCFILANNHKKSGLPARLVVLGDERQSIYQFRGADSRYLSLAPELLSHLTPYTFAELPLSESFRLSQQTVWFINNVFLNGEEYITSSKSGPKPAILQYSLRVQSERNDLAKKIQALIKHHGPENTAILAPSLRNNWPLKALTKRLKRLSKEKHIPIAVHIDDEAPLDDKVINGKVCVSTVHQFKGSERDLVILFDMDSSYFEHADAMFRTTNAPMRVLWLLPGPRNSSS